MASSEDPVSQVVSQVIQRLSGTQLEAYMLNSVQVSTFSSKFNPIAPESNQGYISSFYAWNNLPPELKSS